MDTQDLKKSEWHKPEMISLAGSAAAGAGGTAIEDNTKTTPKGGSADETAEGGGAIRENAGPS